MAGDLMAEAAAWRRAEQVVLARPRSPWALP
jgi:hypothetical protein